MIEFLVATKPRRKINHEFTRMDTDFFTAENAESAESFSQQMRERNKRILASNARVFLVYLLVLPEGAKNTEFTENFLFVVHSS